MDKSFKIDKIVDYGTREKEELTAKIIHEVGTAVNCILLIVEVIKTNGLFSKEKDLMELIEDYSSDLLKTMHEIVDLDTVIYRKHYYASNNIKDQEGAKNEFQDHFQLRKKRVLIVDDDLFNQKLIEKLLVIKGMLVETAPNGLIAMNILKEKAFDVVLMDYNMPVMDGIETTLKIRNELNLSIPIIGMTASDLKLDGTQFIQAGMNDCLGKPFIKEALFGSLLKVTKTDRVG